MFKHFSRIFIVITILTSITACGGGGGDSGTPGGGAAGDVQNTNYNWPAHILGYQISFIVEGDSPSAPTNIPIGSEVIYDYSGNGAVQGTNPLTGVIYYPDSYTYGFSGNVAAINMTYAGGLAIEIYELTPTSATEGTYYYTGNTGSGQGDKNNWGRYIILSKGEEKSFTYTNGVKEVTFEWTPLPDTTYSRLLKDPDGSGGVSVIDGNITEATYTITDISAHLHDYRTQPKNGEFILEVCNSSNQCTEYNRISLADVLIDSIGEFRAHSDEKMGYRVALDSAADTLVTVGYGGTMYRFDKDSNEPKGWRLSQKLAGMDYLGNSKISIDNMANRLLNGLDIYTAQNNAWILDSSLSVNKSGGGTYSSDPIGKTISGDGNTVALLYSYNDGTNLYNYPGVSVIVFKNTNGTWGQQAEIFPDTFSQNISLGSVELSYNGDGLLVSNPMHPSADFQEDDGRIVSYTRANGVWGSEQVISIPDINGSEQFGYATSLSDNGQVAVVLAKSYVYNGSYNWYETIHLMLKSNGVWSVSSLGMLPGAIHRNYSTLEMSDDGMIFVVGNEYDDSPGTGLSFGSISPLNQNYGNSGGAAVYRLNSIAKSATLISFLKQTSGENGSVGNDVAINGNGDTIALGSWSDRMFSADDYVNPESVIQSGGVKGSVFLY